MSGSGGHGEGESWCGTLYIAARCRRRRRRRVGRAIKRRRVVSFPPPRRGNFQQNVFDVLRL